MEIISAREAFDLGLKKYFTGESCSYGHLDERYISNGSCISCIKIRDSNGKAYKRTKEWRSKNSRAKEAARYREKNPDKCKEIQIRYKVKNIDNIRERNKLYKQRIRIINPEKEKRRLREYKERQELKRISIAGRDKSELCEICGLNEFRIVFDHCHNLGHFRGWICDRCNRTLGIIKDDVKILKSMIKYLEKDNGREMDSESN